MHAAHALRPLHHEPPGPCVSEIPRRQNRQARIGHRVKSQGLSGEASCRYTKTMRASHRDQRSGDPNLFGSTLCYLPPVAKVATMLRGVKSLPLEPYGSMAAMVILAALLLLHSCA